MKKMYVVIMMFFVAFALWAGGQEEVSDIKDPAVSSEFDWRRFQGVTIVACWPNHGHYNATMRSGVIEEFEELTGINVEIDLLQYIAMHDKQVLEMTKPGNGDYDMVSMVVMWKSEYAMGDMIEPLKPFFDNPGLAVPGYDFDDLVPGYVEVTGIAGGKNIYIDGPGAALYGLPFGAETSFLVYRKDLFDQYDVDVPETYEELVETARFFHENVPEVGGLTMRGASGHHATHGYLLHASPYGARILEKGTWEPVFTDPESIETIKFMQKMVEYGPPGIAGFTQDEEWQAFLQGNAAMYLDASVFTGAVNDPAKSKVVGKVAYALHPTAKTAGSETGGFGLAIPKNASNPEAAFLFMQFLTMKETERKIIESGGAPFRMSSVNDAQLQARYPEFAVLAEQLQYANPDWRPIIPEWGEINSTIGVYINQALTGEKTPEKAMNDAVEPIREILVRSGYLR